MNLAEALTSFDTAKSRDGAVALLDAVVERARSIFESEGYCASLAMLVSTIDPNTLVASSKPTVTLVLLDHGSGDEDKNKASAMLRETARRLDAFAIAFVTESYVITTPAGTGADAGLEAFNAARKKYGSIKNTPGRREAVLVTLEHCALKGPARAMAVIERAVEGDESSKGTLSKWDIAGLDNEADTLGGRFANLLPGARGN